MEVIPGGPDGLGIFFGNETDFTFKMPGFMKSQCNTVCEVIDLFHGQIRPVLTGGKDMVFCFGNDFIPAKFRVSDISAEECCTGNFAAASHTDFENIPAVAEEMFTRFGVLTYFRHHHSTLAQY
jgi:hypothetical protein